MKILFVTKHNPYATSGGGGIASHAYLRAFSVISTGKIDVCHADYIADDDMEIAVAHRYKVPPRSKWLRLLSVFTGDMHRNTSFVKKLLLRDPSYSLCVFDHSSVAGTLVDYVNNLGIDTLTIHHNYEVDYFRDNSSLLCRLLFLRHVRRNEERAFLYSSYNVFLSNWDKNTFYNKYGQSAGTSIVSGVFHFKEEKSRGKIPVTKKANSPVFVISGTMQDYQTLDGVMDFFDNYYSLLPKDAEVILSGRDPSQALYNRVKGLGNVTIIPNPENMSEVIQKANIYICPTKIGGGVKLRIMDGLRNGLPVLTHAVSARGYESFESEALWSYTDKESFQKGLAEMLDRLYTDKFDNVFINQRFEEYFSLKTGIERIKKHIVI